MAPRITGDCVCCGACQSSCPVSAIVEKNGCYDIDPDLCTDCYACYDTCPVGAIE